jgi:hypothetical protein
VEVSPHQLIAASKAICNLDANKYTLEDIAGGLRELGERKCDEFETRWPDFGTMREAFDGQRRKRLREVAETAAQERQARDLAHAERIRQEREDEWNRKRAAKAADAAKAS